MTTTATEALSSYIENTSRSTQQASRAFHEALEKAYGHAQEYSLAAPDTATGQLLTTITTISTTHSAEKSQVIAITPAASVAGLYLLKGLGSGGILSCIDPEAEHQASAKLAFRTAGFKSTQVRFLPASPLDVIDRLAPNAYQVIYAEVPLLDALAVTKASWPLLRHGGTLVLADTLLDGTLSDTSRTDRTTQAARELDRYVLDIEGATVARLPLGSGLTIITKL